jgi:signal transduction histidine kinase/DNA-binding NarL/FixJ family response regulator/HPt (histidine-containing phosphotransfer) domain-containing protein
MSIYASINAITKKIKPKRPLYVQLLFTIFAFLIMILLSNAFMSNIVRGYLKQNAVNILDAAQAQIISDLIEPQTVLDDVSRITRTMVLRGDNADSLRDYLTTVLEYLLLDNHRNAVYSTLFGYFETLSDGPAFIEGLIKDMADWYDPTERSWYKNAIAENGEIATTMIYSDVIYDSPVLIFSRCIFDDHGHHLGAVGLRIEIDAIGEFVINTASAQGGYGILMSEDLVLFAHPNRGFIGKNIRENGIPLSVLADKLTSGKEITEYPMTSYKGEDAVAFFRQLPNGWYLGVDFPRLPYYQSVIYLAFILSVLGIALASVLSFVLIRVDAARNKSEMENRYKSAFLANMSHEIRTPMNAIIGMTELLANEKLTERQMGFIDDIWVSAHSLLSIINNILDLSKIESGKFTLIPVNYDFHALVDNIVSMFSYVAQKKGLEFKFESTGDLPECLYGDDLRLKQVLTNICGNAVKYTEKGHVKLKTTISNGNLVFEVSDTGMGIRKEDIYKLFDAFERMEIEKNRNINGTGLGLSICRSFVEMMGGYILVDSEYGRGSVFTVIIPAVSGDKKKVKSAKNMGKELPLYAPEAAILVVDDNEFNLRVAEGMLNLFKINTKTAFSGKKAIDMVQDNEFDLVFMDHMMPDMDGVEAVGIIRKLGPKYESLPIIALTANAIHGAKEMFLSSGFNGFISKPIEIQKLKEVLREWLPHEKIVEEELTALNVESQGQYDEASGDFISAIGEIDEIDTEIGLSRVSGLRNMYNETLALFHKRLVAECDAMSAAINAKDIKSFAIKAHAMKSTLSTIGAMNLSVAAFKLETAAKTDDVNYCQERFPAFREKLMNLHKKLSAVFPPDKAKAQKKPGDTNYLYDRIKEALEAGDDFNGDLALKITTDLLARDFGDKNNALLENAAAAFENYDYNAARELLNQILMMGNYNG